MKRCFVVWSLLLGCSFAGEFPSTLQDYVVFYKLRSYEYFQQDSAEYERRIEKGQLALKRMRNHGGLSAIEATKQWFETASYSRDPADELPGLPAVYLLKDTKTIKEVREEGNAELASEASGIVVEAEEVLEANKDEKESLRNVAQQLLQLAIGRAKAAKQNSESETLDSNASDSTDSPFTTPEPSTETTPPPQPGSGSKTPTPTITPIPETQMEVEGEVEEVIEPDVAPSNVDEFESLIPESIYDQSVADVADDLVADLVGETDFPDVGPPVGFVDPPAELRMPVAVTRIQTTPINELRDYIATMETTKRGFEEAVQKIRAIAESQGADDWVEVDLDAISDEPGELDVLRRQVHGMILRCPKSSETISFEEAVPLLQSLDRLNTRN